MYRKDESLNLVVLGNSRKAGKIIFLITTSLLSCKTSCPEITPDFRVVHQFRPDRLPDASAHAKHAHGRSTCPFLYRL